MRFSVVIPVYNRASLVEDAIESVLAQEWDDYELIVVDDGSTDGTPEEVEQRYGDTLRLIEQDNAGPGAARNRGIQETTGDYIAFLDSDDQWFPWTLSTFAQAIEHNNEPSFLAGMHTSVRGRTLQSEFDQDGYEDYWWSDYYSAVSSRHIWVRPPSVAVNAEVLRAVGGFCSHQMNAEDIDLWMRLGTSPGFVLIKSPAVSAYYRHNQGVVNDLGKTYRGICYLIKEEQKGRYPGGRKRADERRRILTRHIRPASVALARSGQGRRAWDLYASSALWQLRQGRAKFLLAMPFVIALGLMRGRNQ